MLNKTKKIKFVILILFISTSSFKCGNNLLEGVRPSFRYSQNWEEVKIDKKTNSKDSIIMPSHKLISYSQISENKAGYSYSVLDENGNQKAFVLIFSLTENNILEVKIEDPLSNTPRTNSSIYIYSNDNNTAYIKSNTTKDTLDEDVKKTISIFNIKDEVLMPIDFHMINLSASMNRMDTNYDVNALYRVKNPFQKKQGAKDFLFLILNDNLYVLFRDEIKKEDKCYKIFLSQNIIEE